MLNSFWCKKQTNWIVCKRKLIRELINLPIACPVIGPVWETQTFIWRAPVVQTGIAVDGIQQVGGSSNNSDKWNERNDRA